MSVMHSARNCYPLPSSEDGMTVKECFEDAMQCLLADEGKQPHRYMLSEASVATDMAMFVRGRLAGLRGGSAVAVLRDLALFLVRREVSEPRQ